MIVHTVNKKTIPYSISCLQEVKHDGKDINCQVERFLRLLMTGSHLLGVLIIGLCPGKFWCLRGVVAYGRCSLTRGNHA